MFEGMTEISLDRTERAEVSLEDEFQNCEPKRMDACDCVSTRQRRGRWLPKIRIGDPFQGAPMSDGKGSRIRITRIGGDALGAFLEENELEKNRR